MPNIRDICFKHWGEKCLGCGVGIGIEAHHIDGNNDNNDPHNLMPLCGTCHNLVTLGTLQVDPGSRNITANILGLFTVGPSVDHPSHQVQVQMLKFKDQVEPWESSVQKQPFLLLQDGVNQSYFVECHVQAVRLVELLYEDAVLDPENLDDPDVEVYKLNRDLQLLRGVFERMQEDAQKGRPFSDIIVEFNQDYAPEQSLKILAGQHRSRAITDAVQAEAKLERLHGIKVYFSLNRDQRQEISLISNTNIAISKQLIDRFGEQYIGPESRKWCQQVGLLEQGKDFADRIAGTERFTVQILRTLIINFYSGKSFAGDIDEALHGDARIPRAGERDPDPEYKKLLKEFSPWDDSAIAEMGRRFAELNDAQVQACMNAPDTHRKLRRVAYRYKVFTPTIAAAWAYVSGLLQDDPQRLANHYSLPSKYNRTASPDPLNAIQMSRTKHENADEVTYRGMATRQSAKDIERTVGLFVLQSRPDLAGTVTKELLGMAVWQHQEKKTRDERERLGRQAREAAQRIRSKST